MTGQPCQQHSPLRKPVRSLTAESDAVHVDLLVLKLAVAERHNLLNEYVSGRRDGVGVVSRTEDETDGGGLTVLGAINGAIHMT